MYSASAEASKPRQVAAARARAKAAGEKIVKTVSEVISGTLPLHRRKQFMELLDNTHISKIYVESARAVARSSKVAQDVFEQSVAKKVQIVPADLPDLFKHDQTPIEKYVRHIIFATTELERDLIVHRLRDGVNRKMATTIRRTQLGKPKVVGSKTVLDTVKPNAKVLKKFQAIALRRANGVEGQCGLRTVARLLSEALSLPRPMGHETARRMCQELLLKRGGAGVEGKKLRGLQMMVSWRCARHAGKVQ